MSTSNYRRPAVLNRPWLAGKLYDDITRTSVLHRDAFVWELGSFKVLHIDWREGGRKQVAEDAYLIEPDGLTPLWSQDWRLMARMSLHWTRATHAMFAPLHARVIAEARLAGERWAQVSVLAHYIKCGERNAEIGANAYGRKLPDIL